MKTSRVLCLMVVTSIVLASCSTVRLSSSSCIDVNEGIDRRMLDIGRVSVTIDKVNDRDLENHISRLLHSRYKDDREEVLSIRYVLEVIVRENRILQGSAYRYSSIVEAIISNEQGFPVKEVSRYSTGRASLSSSIVLYDVMQEVCASLDSTLVAMDNKE